MKPCADIAEFARKLRVINKALESHTEPEQIAKLEADRTAIVEAGVAPPQKLPNGDRLIARPDGTQLVMRRIGDTKLFEEI